MIGEENLSEGAITGTLIPLFAVNCKSESGTCSCLPLSIGCLSFNSTIQSLKGLMGANTAAGSRFHTASSASTYNSTSFPSGSRR